MLKTKSPVKQEIERLVAIYPWPATKDLFRAELEYLVLLAEREQLIADKVFISQEKK